MVVLDGNDDAVVSLGNGLQNDGDNGLGKSDDDDSIDDGDVDNECNSIDSTNDGDFDNECDSSDCISDGGVNYY